MKFLPQMNADSLASWVRDWLNSSVSHRDICVHLRSSAAKIPCFSIRQPQPGATQQGPAAIPTQWRVRPQRFLGNAAVCGYILLHLAAAAPAIAQSPPIAQSPTIAHPPTIVHPSTIAPSLPDAPTPTIAQSNDDGAPPNESPCEQAGRQAERAHDLPSGLLLAIGRVESGRWDAARGRVVPWPWAVDAGGNGTLLDNKESAIAHTAALRDAGTRNVDVGCFQINLASHPSAFTDLQQAFDPVANADYAARFLLDLHAHLGNWNDAVAAYHSAQPDLGTPYRQAVFANWPMGGHAAVADIQSGPVVVELASGARIRIWTPSSAGTAANNITITPVPSASLPVTPASLPITPASLPHVLVGRPSPQ
jgi:soluble lytic murein transglycosylase-like protein